MDFSTYLYSAVEKLLRMGPSELLQPTVYDTTWAARLTNYDGSPAYPHLLSWIVERQNPDGSWGSRIPYIHDRLLTTLSTVILLAYQEDYRNEQCQLDGVRYIRQQANTLHREPHRTIGFEMILPALLTEGKELGLDLPYVSLRRYERERAHKFSILPLQRLFRTHTTALFSLEAFTGYIDISGAASLLLENGSMVNSPSATAYFLSQIRDWRSRFPQSVAYLEDLLQHNVGLPPVAPCDIFARAWTLYYLHYGGLLANQSSLLQSHYDYLLGHWHPEGVGFTSSSKLADSDDSALALLALQRAGYEIDGSCLLAYEKDQYFSTLGHERDPSVSVNLHILEALGTLPESQRPRVREKVLSYILRTRRRGAFWSDKWHASIYYPTSRALMILPPHVPEEMQPTLDWLFSTQHADGSWGQYMPTVEESALVLLALLHYHRTVHQLPYEPLRRGAEFLLANEHAFEGTHPELWIGKALYTPLFAVRSSMLAALALYYDTFGTTP